MEWVQKKESFLAEIRNEGLDRGRRDRSKAEQRDLREENDKNRPSVCENGETTRLPTDGWADNGDTKWKRKLCEALDVPTRHCRRCESICGKIKAREVSLQVSSPEEVTVKHKWMRPVKKCQKWDKIQKAKEVRKKKQHRITKKQREEKNWGNS
jgi:hypothetical protein